MLTNSNATLTLLIVTQRDISDLCFKSYTSNIKTFKIKFNPPLGVIFSTAVILCRDIHSDVALKTKLRLQMSTTPDVNNSVKYTIYLQHHKLRCSIHYIFANALLQTRQGKFLLQQVSRWSAISAICKNC